MELQLLALAVLFIAVFSSVERVGERQFISSKSFRRTESTRRKIDNRFDYFLFVQQWPGSYCDTKKGCCFPVTGEPGPAFGIHGLWPNRNDGTYPKKCRNIGFDPNEVKLIPYSLKRTQGVVNFELGFTKQFRVCIAARGNDGSVAQDLGHLSVQVEKQRRFLETRMVQARRVLGSDAAAILPSLPRPLQPIRHHRRSSRSRYSCG